MVVVSKHLVTQIQDIKCQEIFHSWEPNCLVAASMMVYSTMKGSTVFFTASYLLQYLPKYKELTTKDAINIFKKLVWSITTAVTYIILYNFAICFLRKLFGYYPYFLIAYLIPLLPGFAIFIENPMRRSLLSSSFTSMCVEGLFNKMYIMKLKKRNIYIETLFFMLCNGLLMSMLKDQKSLTNDDYKELWFYMPKETGTNDDTNKHAHENIKLCSHQNSCFSHGMKETSKYVSLSFALSIFKIIWIDAKLLKTPKEFLKQIFMVKNLKLSMFTGAYLFIYKTINCYLHKKIGKESQMNGFISGFAAGIPYQILPNLALLSSLLSVLLRVTARKLKNKYKLPNLPYQEITFIISNLFLLNTMITFGEASPSIFMKILAACTNGRSDDLYDSFSKTILEHQKNLDTNF